MTMVLFKSIIVLDLETTSLPHEDHNTTKITELAVIGCEVAHLKNCKELPRVLHKLVLLFNPNKRIFPKATQASGLSNDLLFNVKPFRKEDVEVLRHFIDRFPSPVCIVAHNGNKFDFPVLRRALENVKMELQNNVYCADSLEAFKKLLPKTRPGETKSDNMVTPPHQKPQQINEISHKRVARELFPDDEALTQWSIKMENELFIPNSTPESYKLQDIYKFFFKRKFEQQHRAEMDSQALLRCIMACEGFLEWINRNENTVIFNSIQPLF